MQKLLDKSISVTKCMKMILKYLNAVLRYFILYLDEHYLPVTNDKSWQSRMSFKVFLN